MKGAILMLSAIFMQPLIPKFVLAENLNGIYWAETGSDDGIEIIGNKYQYLDPTSSSWRKVSELSFIKKGVIQIRSNRTYYCSNKLPRKSNISYICTQNGWKKQSIAPP
jgi:hypothetical protein